MERIFYYDSPVGPLAIAENGAGITRLAFARQPVPATAVTGTAPAAAWRAGVRPLPQHEACRLCDAAAGFRRLRRPGRLMPAADLPGGPGTADAPRPVLDETPLLREARDQLDAYFAGSLTAFDLPLAPAGTPFQQQVWRALCAIPYGETRTYAQVAARIGLPAACRAVGGANNRNPIAIVIPCHRVVGAGGMLTGYAGGLDVKRYLLDLEAQSLFGR